MFSIQNHQLTEGGGGIIPLLLSENTKYEGDKVKKVNICF